MAGGKRGARTGLENSVFDVRPDNKPAWPTFRGALLTDEALDRLEAIGGWVFFNRAKHIEHELENGGLSRGGEPHEYNMVSFERRLHVERVDTGKRTVLYCIGWIGGYGKGSIWHIGWQFPHCCERTLESIERESFKFYGCVAKALYGDDDWDSEVAEFVRAGYARWLS
jgi:hypothetical protein